MWESCCSRPEAVEQRSCPAGGCGGLMRLRTLALPRKELEDDFPQLSKQVLDDAEILARLPKPPGRSRKALALKRG